jgi:hypothetical protein
LLGRALVKQNTLAVYHFQLFGKEAKGREGYSDARIHSIDNLEPNTIIQQDLSSPLLFMIVPHQCPPAMILF